MPKLTWIGKDKVVNHHHEVPFRVLKKKYPFKASENNSHGNKIIHGDNLEALKSLLPEYEGKIKCIYIDPPYNTGNEGWIYNDNVNDEKIKRWLGQVVGKEGEDLSRHDKWLCMMYPRLKLLHKLLAEDGAIFISIDDNENGNLRIILDEIFGNNNLITTVIWQKIYTVKNSAKYFSEMHDYIVAYAKRLSSWHRNLLPRNEELNASYTNPDNDPRGDWTTNAIQARNFYSLGSYEITSPTGKKFLPPAGTYWRVSKEKFEELNNDKRVWWGKNGESVPRIKKFLTEAKEGVVPATIWFHEDVGTNAEAKAEVREILKDDDKIFITPKPTRLIKRILELTTDKKSIVLDSFAGSGTTAHSVLKLNNLDKGDRKFILVETMDYAETITAERVRRVMQGYGEDSKAVEGLGGSFDFYEMGDAIFLSDGNLNESIGVDEIRCYVAFTENIPSDRQVSQDNEYSPYLLGFLDETAYFFVYEPEKTTALNLEFLATLNFRPKASVMYADNCLLSDDELKRFNIIFKKIPRDITRF